MFTFRITSNHMNSSAICFVLWWWSQQITPIRQHTPTSNILCVLLLLVKVFVFFFHPLPSVGSTRKPNHYRSVAAERLRARVSNTLRSEIEGGVFESSTHRTRRPHNACAKFSFTSWKLFLGFCPASAKKITKKSPNFLQGPDQPRPLQKVGTKFWNFLAILSKIFRSVTT